MRAKEFVVESSKEDMSDSAIAAIPNARIWPELDNSSPYMAYRFGVALAGAPNKEMPQVGPVKQNMVTIGYTDADDEITQAAGRMMGTSSKSLSSKGSKENNVNKSSPVAKPKKNRYGV
jgi:hypothetical protein